LRQRRPRERLKKWASPVSRVNRRASSSIHASISTRFESASWTMAGVSSGSIAERDTQPMQLGAEGLETGGILVEDRGEQRRLRNVERIGHVAGRPCPA